ncbi:MAG: UDP-3-O-acyl-N-acetylglucosamine deacetylase, partial [Rickettsia endosymbiont of Ixodes persulcatus]|nr:UDP-3-O-acyl-N-acetylglucosamine deacetylase [Rickettsia endosymbiont of Ixodes persulcatus]
MTSSIFPGNTDRTTLSAKLRLDGIGLHSGSPSSATLSPGKSGIRIIDGGRGVPLKDITVARTPRCTRLELPSGRRIDMVEHLLAALRVTGITDLDIDFQGDEVPVLDGSSSVWLSAIRATRTVGLSGPVDCLVVMEETFFEIG